MFGESIENHSESKRNLIDDVPDPVPESIPPFNGRLWTRRWNVSEIADDENREFQMRPLFSHPYHLRTLLPNYY